MRKSSQAPRLTPALTKSAQGSRPFRQRAQAAASTSEGRSSCRTKGNSATATCSWRLSGRTTKRAHNTAPTCSAKVSKPDVDHDKKA